MIIPPLLLLLLVLAPPPRAAAVQLSELFNLPQYEYFPLDFRTLPDGTASLVGLSSFSIPELALPPFVKFPPLPAFLSETQVVARVHPENGTAVWAAAIAEMENGADVAVDPRGNTYVAGIRDRPSNPPAANAFRVVKYGPRGDIRWARDYPDPSFGKGPVAAAARGFWLDFSNGRFIHYTRGRLVLSGLRPGLSKKPDRLALVIRPRDGRLVAVRPLAAPARPSPTRPEKRAFAAAGGVACFAVTSETDQFAERLFVQCRRLAGGRAVTRRIPLPGKRLSSIELGMTAGACGRPPQVWAVFSGEAGPKSHKIGIYRMNARTLHDVDWETGQSTGQQEEGFIIDFTTPGRLGEAGTVLGVEYSTALDTLVVGYASTAKIKRIVRKKKMIAIKGARAYTVPAQTYVMLFDSSRRLKSIEIPDDPREGEVADDFNHLLVTSIGLSADKRKTYLFGALQKIRRGEFLAELGSGPFYFHTVPIPPVAP